MQPGEEDVSLQDRGCGHADSRRARGLAVLAVACWPRLRAGLAAAQPQTHAAAHTAFPVQGAPPPVSRLPERLALDEMQVAPISGQMTANSNKAS